MARSASMVTCRSAPTHGRRRSKSGRQRVQLHMLLEFAAALDVPATQLLPDNTAASDPLGRVPADTRPFVRDVLKTAARARSRG